MKHPPLVGTDKVHAPPAPRVSCSDYKHINILTKKTLASLNGHICLHRPYTFYSLTKTDAKSTYRSIKIDTCHLFINSSQVHKLQNGYFQGRYPFYNFHIYHS